MAKSTVFKTNRSQAVRIPKELALPENVRRVEVIAVGSGRLIVPEGQSWDHWFEYGPRLTDDFRTDLDDLPPEEREPL